nr:MAG TPA: hypothetical protein [Caudoviricetes sp.]
MPKGAPFPVPSAVRLRTSAPKFSPSRCAALIIFKAAITSFPLFSRLISAKSRASTGSSKFISLLRSGFPKSRQSRY